MNAKKGIDRTLEKIIEDIDTIFEKAMFEYGSVLNARKYYDLLLNFFLGRYSQIREVREYISTYKARPTY